MLIVFTLFLFLPTFGNCAKIVALYPLGTKSHFYVIKPALEELSVKGHQITVFTPYRGISNGIQNSQEVVLDSIANFLEEVEIDWFAMQKRGFFIQHFELLYNFFSYAPKLATEFLNNSEFRRIIKERDVDLFVIDGFGNEFVYAIIDMIGVPFVTSSATVPMPVLLSGLGAPTEYAYAPSTMVDYSNNMSFFERVGNTLMSETIGLIRRAILFPYFDTIVRQEFPDAKRITEVEGNPSISFFNSHPTIAFPRSLPQNVICTPAMHIKPSKALPQNLRSFADEATNGLIIFSLGSFIHTSSMPNETLQIFKNVLTSLPYRVVWKWEREIPTNIATNNILFTKWIPQQDLLGHPNVRLFISHGGLLGTQEAIYHGIPFISLPFGNDQRTVTKKPRLDGYAIQLNWNTLTESELTNAITYLAEEPSVKEKAKKASALLKDRMLPTVDVAVYWIEHVLRHGGINYSEPISKSMPFYKRHLLDVVGFMAAIILASGYILYYFLSHLLKRIRTSPLKDTTTFEKKNE